MRYAALLLPLLCYPLAAQDAPAGCAVSGTVVNTITGEPLVRAMVALGSDSRWGAATDDKGRWSIAGPICGTTHPSATHTGFFRGVYRNNAAAAPGESEEAEADGVALAPGAAVRDIKIALTPQGSISGRVQDASGDPIGRASVEVLRVAVRNGRRALLNEAWLTTDTRGNFASEGLASGRYLVCAHSSDRTFPAGGGATLIYADECFPGPLVAGLSIAQPVRGNELRVSLTLRTTQGYHVRGKVIGPEGMPPARIELAAMPSDPLRERTADGTLGLLPFGHGAVSGRDGDFDLADVLPGSYRLEAVIPPSNGVEPLFAEALLELGAADAENVKLVLRPVGSINGTVRSEAPGKSQTAARPIDISLATLSGFAFAPDAVWNAAGTSFLVPQVAPGQYQLQVTAGDGASWVKSAALNGRDVLNQALAVSGPTGPIDIVVSEELSDVDVSVTDASGNPVVADVILAFEGSRPILLHAAPDGHARKHGIPSGEYRVWAFDEINDVPWADEAWMAQFAGTGQPIVVKTGATAAVTLQRLTAPK